MFSISGLLYSANSAMSHPFKTPQQVLHVGMKALKFDTRPLYITNSTDFPPICLHRGKIQIVRRALKDDKFSGEALNIYPGNFLLHI